LPEAAEVALYRVAQECLSNVIRLSGNSRAKARLSVEEGRLTFAVGDEGQGLPAEALHQARRGVGELGVAIAGMRERMARLGGTLDITGTGSSTWVTATLPVPQLQSS
jgi:signal transduction histidine kinase